MVVLRKLMSKQYTSRDLQVKTKEILNSLPVEITKHGKIVALMTAPGEVREVEEKISDKKLEVEDNFVEVVSKDPSELPSEIIGENRDGVIVAKAKVDYCKFTFHADKMTRKVFNVVKVDENDVTLFKGWACQECINGMFKSFGRVDAL